MGNPQEYADDELYGIAVGPDYTLIPARYDELYEKAACKGADTEKWFAGTYKGPNRQVGESSLKSDAVKVCHRCPVKKLCADFAIETQPLYGVYAGRPACDWKRVVDGKEMRRTCYRCGRRRLDKFFTEPDVPVCVDCLVLPPDEDLADMMKDLSFDEVVAFTGAEANAVYDAKRRLMLKGLLPPTPWGRKGGRPRTCPSDWDMLELFDANVPSSALARWWGVSVTTVYYHRRRLAS